MIRCYTRSPSLPLKPLSLPQQRPRRLVHPPLRPPPPLELARRRRLLGPPRPYQALVQPRAVP